MLVAKASHVSFERPGDTRGRPSIIAPKSNLLLHDEEGESWPRCSVLIGPCRASRTSFSPTPAARRYFGRGYEPRAMTVTLPPRDLGAWKQIGEVERIYYVRRGNIMGGALFQHPFKGGGRRRFFLWGPKLDKPVLYKSGAFLRLELPQGCIVNHRGFVVP